MMWERDNEVRAELLQLPDPASLWRYLVTNPRTGEQRPTVAIELFTRLHGEYQPGGADSALLLCTDWAWRRSSKQVLAGILDAEILDDADQNALAEEFLWKDKAHYVHPQGWHGTTFLEFDVTNPDPSRARRVHIDPDRLMTTERHVWPPLRAWAAARLLTQRTADPADLLERARSLPAHDGAAVAAGAAQVADQLDGDATHTVLEATLRWGHKSPRKTALEQLVARGERDRAHTLAAADPDASIRNWAAKLADPGPEQGSLFS